jgi:hypothetical protein
MFSESLPDNEDELKAHIKRLAAERIHFFEQKIRDEFGLNIQAGVELEFFGEKGKKAKHLSTKKLRSVLSDVPFMQDVKNDLGWTSNAKLIPAVSSITGLGMYATDTDSPSLGIVSGLFVGAYMSAISYFSRQYEVTFNNITSDGVRHSLSDLADTVIKTRETLEAHAQDIGVKSVSFESKYYPHTVGFRTAPSMHVNLSLWSEQKTNMLTDKEIHDACERALLDMQYESGLVMLGTRNAYESLKEGYNRTQQISAGRKMNGNSLARRGKTEEDKRYESRLPRADTDPHLTLLASVAALYEGLCRKRDGHAQAQETQDSRALPRDIYEAYNRFDESEMTKRLFGAELHEAVLKLFDKELSKDDMINWGPYPSGGPAVR